MLINKDFRENWLEILKYNSNVDLGDRLKIGDKKVKIPLTPIEIEPHVLYFLFEILYPKFINNQQNIIDVIISNDGKTIQSLYLYETKKAGIHESVEKLPLDFIKFKKKHLVNVESIYNRIVEKTIKKKNLRVSSIRLLKEKAIEHINEYHTDLNELPVATLIRKALDVFQIILAEDLFYIYPEPKLLKNIKQLILFLNPINLTELFQAFYDLLPEFNLSFILGSNELMIILHLQKKILSTQAEPYLDIKIMSPNELGVNLAELSKKEMLNLLKERLKTDKVYYLDQKDIITCLTEIFPLSVNLRDENLQLFFQKILFLYRSYNRRWTMAPKPIVYNNLLRFLLRILGFNMNLRKLSHWAIPSFFSNLIGHNLGLNFKVLLILTNEKKFKNSKASQSNYLEKTTKSLLLVEVENKTIKKISPLKKEEIIINDATQVLKSVWVKLSKKHGFISTIVILDTYLIEYFMQNFLFDHYRFGLFSKIKAIKMLKNKKYFYMFPELPVYKMIQKKGAFSLFKILLPIFIDKHEF
ncbi:MAG: hypothetical protein ACW986_19355 [Promethearchaeota archaeon]|jgi:hypothetical protein